MIHLHDSDVIVIVDFMAFSTRMAPNTRHSVVQCAKKCPIAQFSLIMVAPHGTCIKCELHKRQINSLIAVLFSVEVCRYFSVIECTSTGDRHNSFQSPRNRE